MNRDKIGEIIWGLARGCQYVSDEFVSTKV